MRTGLRSFPGLVLLLLVFTPVSAEDDVPRFARPSVEELAVQPSKA